MTSTTYDAEKRMNLKDDLKKRIKRAALAITAAVTALATAGCAFFGFSSGGDPDRNKVRVILEQAEGLSIKSERYVDVLPGEEAVFDIELAPGYSLSGLSEGVYDEASGRIILKGARYPTTLRVTLKNEGEPVASPSAEPSENTPAPTAEPSGTPANATPTPGPTVTPTAVPTATPTSEPTSEPSSEPSGEQTAVPTTAPTAEITSEPTSAPTEEPTPPPTTVPTATPTSVPTATPTSAPTATPEAGPTAVPTPESTNSAEPTKEPTATPTAEPTLEPTVEPTVEPTAEPTPEPVYDPVTVTLKDPARPESLENENAEQTGSFKIVYYANGGKISGSDSESAAVFFPLKFYICPNTLPDVGYFSREGYILAGYTENRDGTGKYYGPGWNIIPEEGEDRKELYCLWKPYSQAEDFGYVISGEGAIVTRYLGSADSVVIPETIEGKKVVVIGAGAFKEATVREVYVPKYVETIGDNAFAGCGALQKVYLSDSVLSMNDNAFANCPELSTLNLLAVRNPAYSASEHGTSGQIKYERLMTAKGKKLVIVGGSNALYGIDSPLIQEKLGNEYTVINMGITVFNIAVFVLETVSQNVSSGDLVVMIPEVKEQQWGLTAMNATMWQCLEGIYDAVAAVDIRNYTDVYSSLAEFNNSRLTSRERTYKDYTTSISFYGEYAKYFEGTTETYAVRQEQYARSGGIVSFKTGATIVEDYGENCNRFINAMKEKGCETLLSFAVVDRSSLRAKSGADYVQGSSETPPDVIVYEDAIDRSFAATRISKVCDYIYEPEFFYNSQYHLNGEGRAIRSGMLADDVLRYIGGGSGETGGSEGGGA